MKLKLFLGLGAVASMADAFSIPFEQQVRDLGVWEFAQKPLQNQNTKIPTAEFHCMMDGKRATYNQAKIGNALTRARLCKNTATKIPNTQCDCKKPGTTEKPEPVKYPHIYSDYSELFPSGTPCHGSTLSEFPIFWTEIASDDKLVYCKGVPEKARVIYREVNGDYEYCGIVYHPTDRNDKFELCQKRTG